ncbi:FecR family protein [Dyadobacter bucti]|uniref:FecR family protein n=1 Tax=Dyadobacter bucti TaxID=2572203 RepID=UPI001109ABA5|nr:FecR domain-containing protein [Dyadobacter bucti]
MNTEINKALIFTYFSGRATAFQKKMIEEWVAEASSREQFFVWLQEWEQENLQYYADVDNGIARHWQRLYQEEHTGGFHADDVHESDRKNKKSIFSKVNWLVAASVLVSFFSLLWFFRDHVQYQVHQTDYNETRRIELADGSKVVLNSNSSLRVPRFGFGTKTRKVLLYGEADFDIVHTTDHQKFVVKTGKDVDIVVLGTEFNVYARPRGTKVMLNKGKVQLRYQEGSAKKMLTMRPGDFVTMDVNGRPNLQKTKNPQKFTAWKAHRFIFEKTTLREVCHLFEDNFGLQVQIPDTNLAQLTISGSFTALNAEELLEILTEDSGLSYEKSEDGQAIILSF